MIEGMSALDLRRAFPSGVGSPQVEMISWARKTAPGDPDDWWEGWEDTDTNEDEPLTWGRFKDDEDYEGWAGIVDRPTRKPRSGRLATVLRPGACWGDGRAKKVA
jgi:hypothetical protein